MYKTKVLAKASLSNVVSKELTDIDILAAKANSKQEVVTLEAQKDLMRMVSILVSTGMNKNDDVFLREEILPIRNTGAHKPVNIEHDAEQIVGHMTKTYATLKDGTIIDNNDNNVPEDFDITNEAVIYKFLFPELAQFIKEKADANALFVSIEMWFEDYDYLLGSIVVRRNEDTSPILDKHLRANGGEGFYEGEKIGRVLRGCLIAGIGIVKNPANIDSVIKSVSNVHAEDVLIKDTAIISNIIGTLNQYGKVTAMDKLTAAVWTTEFINNLPDSSFAVIEKGGKKEDGKTVPRTYRHLPYKDANGKVDVPHLRNALARMNQIQATSPDDNTERVREAARKVLIRVAKKVLPNTKFAESALDVEFIAAFDTYAGELVLDIPDEPNLPNNILPDGSIAPALTTIPGNSELAVTPQMIQVAQQGNIFTPPPYPHVKQEEYNAAIKEKDIVIGYFGDMLDEKLNELQAQSKTQKEKESQFKALILAKLANKSDAQNVPTQACPMPEDMDKMIMNNIDSLWQQLYDVKQMVVIFTRKERMRTELGMSEKQIQEDWDKFRLQYLDNSQFDFYIDLKKDNKSTSSIIATKHGDMDDKDMEKKKDKMMHTMEKMHKMMKEKSMDMEEKDMIEIMKMMDTMMDKMGKVSTNNIKEGGPTTVVANQEPAAAPVAAPVVVPQSQEMPTVPAPQTVVTPEVVATPTVQPTNVVTEPAPIAPVPVVDAVPSLERVQPVDPPISVITDTPAAPSITQQMGAILIDLLSNSNPKWKNLKL